jgi:pimeloyl-ACP methyl ester carboxylesterase
MDIKHLSIEGGTVVSYVGPDLDAGALPALFYFALSGDESLGLDPFNQPVAFLSKFPMRIFSLSLPFHGPGLSPHDALSYWAKEISQGHDLISAFVDGVKRAFDKLRLMGALLPDRVAVAGLSRGAFMACHVAAKIPEIKTILGFAPLTELIYAKEFQALQDHALARNLGLHALVNTLSLRTVRCYIGNLDTRVSTLLSFQFIEALAKAAQQAGVRSPPIELIIGPSIGQMGHGTSQEVFEKGARWVVEKLQVAHAS